MRFAILSGLAVCLALAMAPAHAAFLIEIDTDGLDDGVLTFNSNFAFGGDTNAASQSSPSTAVGLSGSDSIFGGDGSNVDTYTATYTPAVDGDNANLGGVALNDEGNVGSPVVAGSSGVYDVYATWPVTRNTSGGPINFRLNDGSSDLFSVSLDQNTVQGFVDPDDGLTYAGGEWIYLGSAALDASTTYTLIQESTAATFVSMRASGYLFDAAVPEPATATLAALAGLGLVALRRRSK